MTRSRLRVSRLELLLRLLTSFFIAVTLAGLGLAGSLLASAPRPLSLILEPLCLLLLPGIAPALAVAGSHDFSPNVLLACALLIYTGLAFWLLTRTAARRHTQDHLPETEHASAHSR